MNNMDRGNKERIRITAIAYAVFAALLPLNQVYKLSGGITINRVTGTIVLIVCAISVISRSHGTLFIEKELKPILLFIIWGIVTVLWSIDGTTFPLNFLLSFFMVLFAMLIRFNERELEFIKIALCISTVLIAVYMSFVAERTTLRAVLMSETGESDPNSLALQFSAAFIIVLDYLLKNKHRILCYAGLIILGLAILLTGSRTGMFTGLVATLYLIIVESRKTMRRGRLVRLIVIIVVFYVGINYFIAHDFVNIGIFNRLKVSTIAETGANGRFDIWRIYIKAIFDDPLRMLFGYGLGTYESIAYRFSSTHVSPHNDYLGYAATLGIVGLIIVIEIFRRQIVKAWNSNSHLSVALVMITAIGCLSLGYFSNDKSALNNFILAWQLSNCACLYGQQTVKNKYSNE